LTINSGEMDLGKKLRRIIRYLENGYIILKGDRVVARNQALIPTLAVTQLFPNLFQTAVCLSEIGSSPSGTSVFETYILASLVQCLKPRTLFEFGTSEGRTTLQLALNSPDDATIYTLDLPENHVTRYDRAFPGESAFRRLPVGGLFNAHSEARKITQLLADSASANLGWLRGKVDFVFVDGDHAYEYVKSDSENAFSMLSPNGVVLWHDYGRRWKDVARCLAEIAAQKKKRLYHLDGTCLVVCGASTSEVPIV
jgi:Methyltransferase domain